MGLGFQGHLCLAFSGIFRKEGVGGVACRSYAYALKFYPLAGGWTSGEQGAGGTHVGAAVLIVVVVVVVVVVVFCLVGSEPGARGCGVRGCGVVGIVFARAFF